MKPARPRKPAGKFRWLRALVIFTLLVGVGGAATAIAYVNQAVAGLPPLPSIEPRPSLTSTVYARDGSVLAELHAHEHRMPVRLSQVPLHVRNAFIAMEDHRFYSHFGLDLLGIARAVYVNLTGQGFQGASTITQQLARNAFLTMEQTYGRKIQEAILAIQMERTFTKDEILEMYLNQINFGRGAYGVQAAAQAYFRKDISEVNLAEAALLAALPWRPPLNAVPADMLKRQRDVLEKMHRHGFITSEEREAAQATELVIHPRPQGRVHAAPFFVDHILQFLLDRFGRDMVYTRGLQVYTTLDPRMQAAMENSIRRNLDGAHPVREGQPPVQAAALILDPGTGQIRAMVGGRAHETVLGLNRVFSLRQPGSAIKPLSVYVPALDRGFSPGNVIDDAPLSIPQLPPAPPFEPVNYYGTGGKPTFSGLVTLREALDRSLNVPAVKLLYRMGPQVAMSYLRQLGITTLVSETTAGGLTDLALAPLALGGLTRGVSLMEMAMAYAVLANQGIQVDPVAVLRVVDADGNVLYEAVPRPRIVLSEATSYMITNMLRTVITRGTGRSAAIGRPVAGKTGTTDEYSDAWFFGYTPDLLGAVWMGYDRDLTMADDRVTGGSIPARIWADMMRPAHEGLPVREFPILRGDQLVEVEICTKSGKLPGPWCPPAERAVEIFLRERAPTEPCTVHVQARVCRQHPQYLASPYCPATVVRTFIRRDEPYFVRPDGIRPRDAHQEVPTQVCPYHQPAGTRPGGG